MLAVMLLRTLNKAHALSDSEKAIAAGGEFRRALLLMRILYHNQAKISISLSEKRISHCQGKGSLTHNNRKFNAKNVDGRYGIIDYFWPEWMGFKIDNTDKPLDSIHPLEKDNPLPYDLTGEGPMDGKNISDKKYCFDKLCIPYISDLGVYREILFPVFDEYCHIIDIITESKCDTGNICLRVYPNN